MAFLNNEGVQHLWDKVVDALKGKANKKHKHGIEAVTGLQTALDAKVTNPDLASVGQTIIVKEVDENGKPTKWESAEYQPRTHWMGEKVMLERTFANNDASGKNLVLGSPAMGLTVGKTYNVIINGAAYECVAQSGRNAELGADLIWLGNPVIVGGAANDMPFCLADVVGVDAYVATGMATGLNTVSVVGADEVNAIPTEYLTEGFPYQIAIMANVSDGATEYFCGVTVAYMMELFNSGIELKLIIATIGTGAYYFYSMVAYESTELGGRFTFASLSGLDGRAPLLLVLEPQENGSYAVQGQNI